MDRLQAFFESLFRLSGGQWRVLLSLLACANLIVYAAVGWLLYVYVFTPLAVPTGAVGRTPTPTLRPTFTPTWTATPTLTLMPTDTPRPTYTSTPTRTPTLTWTPTVRATAAATVTAGATLSAAQPVKPTVP